MTHHIRSLLLRVTPVVAVSLFMAAALTSNGPNLIVGSDRVSAHPIYDPAIFLQEAKEALASKFRIGGPAGPLVIGEHEIKAFQRFNHNRFLPDGRFVSDAFISMEVHQNDDQLSVWICVPHEGLSGHANPAAYLWYQYVKDETGAWMPVGHPLLEVPPFPAPDIPDNDLFHLSRTYLWSHGSGCCGPFPDPHWVAILTRPEESDRTR